ncbi:MAG: tail fiber protein [Acidimicrobiia bacterium]|nr:tail fiber protein [Acidimicrobiia bacterium]
MPLITPCVSLPFPTDADPVDVAGDIARLALAVDGAICGVIGGVVPLGTILPWWDNGGTAPAGTLRCNGDPFTATTWPQLAAFLGSAITPDLRGRFLRGVDDDGGPFPGRGQTGGFADAQLAAHTHGNDPHTHPITHDHPASIASGGSHIHNINHNHSASSAGAGQHGHNWGNGAIFPYRNNASTLGFPVTGNPGNVFWWQYGDATFLHDGNHAHSITVNTVSANSGSADHSHSIVTPSFSGSSQNNTPFNTQSAGGVATNRNLPPFANVTFLIQAATAA